MGCLPLEVRPQDQRGEEGPPQWAACRWRSGLRTSAVRRGRRSGLPAAGGPASPPAVRRGRRSGLPAAGGPASPPAVRRGRRSGLPAAGGPASGPAR